MSDKTNYQEMRFDAHPTQQMVDACCARIAALEAERNTSICIFCGTTMDKDLNVMLEHAKGCEKRPENELMRRIAELGAENERLKRGCNCANFNGYKQDCCLDLSPCHMHSPCHFTPSCWAERTTS